MANIRHVVVVRKDLQMPPGLLAAQVCHICDGFMRNHLLKETGIADNPPTRQELDWCQDPYLSVLAVNSYEDLCEIEEHARRQNLPLFVWHDVVPSPTIENKNIDAYVGLSIGPADFDKIKMVTGALEAY